MTPNRPLKGIVDFSDRFRHLPLWSVLCLAGVAAILTAFAWMDLLPALVFALLCVVDGVMLVLLPRLRRSFGPAQLPWLSLILIRLTAALLAVLLPWSGSLVIMLLLQVGLTVVAFYACWIEPMQLGITHVSVRTPHLKGCPPLRILQISDLHVERITARERRLLEVITDLQPDVIAVTGDYVNISYTHDAQAHSQVRELLNQMQAPQGVFIIRGSPSVDPPALVARLSAGLGLTWLRNEMAMIDWHGRHLEIAGVECSYDLEDDEARLRRVLDGREEDRFTVLLYHTPDLMPLAAQMGVDLYLAGHTHGGQLRLPFYGALVTASTFGKRYEMGRYQEQRTTLYVSRGVGMEGKGAPRARFLCRPEVTVFTLEGDGE